ncbi:MAG: GNAT family N-acetyltransferase [Halobacteria archaeon]|nr:GNAT family N-acetyltransferase [Halobacteria archaeon]
MTSGKERPYPDKKVGPFPTPPIEFVDREGRTIEIREYGNGPVENEFWELVEMYDDFDPADRAQGLPPTREDRICDWLDMILRGLNVVAWHEETVAGHAMLVRDDTGAYELAIFVHQDYQRAGIGSRLIRALLGHGVENGVERVWLTVERWNTAAVNLYEDVGFEKTNGEKFELEMSIRLKGPE